MTDLVPLAANGSGGVSYLQSACGKQTIWTYCSGTGTAIYYNNCTDYVIANDTDRLPMEVELGNGTSYLPLDVWDISHWLVLHLAETTGTTAIDSTSRSNGTYQGGVILDVDGRFDGGATFDGVDDYVNGFTHTAIPNGLTYSAWVNTTSTDSTSSYAGSAANNVIGDSTEGVARGFGVHGGKVRYCVYTGNWECIDTVKSVNDGGLHQIAVTHHADNSVKIYIDGVLNKTTSITYHTTSGFDMIAAGYSVVDYFNGTLDEVRVSNVTRSAAYLNQAYQNAIGTSGYGDLGAEETSAAAVTFNVSINSPSDNTVTSDNTTSHNFTAIGSEATYDCTLYYNDSSKGTNASVSNNTATVITSSEVSNGGYNWYVNCTSGTATNQSEIYVITIQSGMPSINAPTIIPATLYETQKCTGLTTATDDTTSILILNYSLSVDDVIKISGNKSILNNNQSCVPELGAGNYSSTNVVNITVRAWDGTFWSFENSSKVTVSALPSGGNATIAKERFVIRHGGML